MKKFLVTIVMAAVFAVMLPAMSGTASAQTVYPRPGFYSRHRKLVNIGISTGAGTIIGALIGGKKGALIGGGAGLGTGLIINKKQRSRIYYPY